MKTKNKTQLWLKYGLMSFLAVAVLGTAYFVSDFLLIAKNNIQLEELVNQKPIAKALAYTNEKGQNWYLSNPGKNVFNIGGNIKDGPKIVKAEIDPLKVSVGQKQTMSLEVNSNQPLTKVIAEITTDHKTITVELKQTAERDLTLDDVKNSPFLVKDSGEVVFSAEKSPTSKFVYDNLVNRFFETAQASNVRHYTFSGDWIVHDTGETTYRTKFTAYDSNNKSNSTTLAWSDPCSFPISKNIDWAVGGLSGTQFGYFEDTSKTKFVITNQLSSATCSESNTSGIEGVNYEIRTGTEITISDNFKLIRTPGTILTLANGAYLNLPSSATTKITKGYVWLKDNDGDGFFTTTPEKRFTVDNTPPSGSGGGGNELGYYLKRKFSGITNKLTKSKLFANRTKADEIQCASTGQVTWSKTSSINNNNNYLLNNSSVLDCDDSRSHAKPGSSLYCATPRANGSHDYNCNNSIEKENTNVSEPVSGGYSNGYELCEIDEFNKCSSKSNPNFSSGFLNQAPECGSTETYVNYTVPKEDCTKIFNPDSCISIKLGVTTEQKTQRCR